MGGIVAGIFELFGAAVRGEALVGEHAVRGTDAFHQSLAEALFRFLFQDLVLEGRASSVDDENFFDHGSILIALCSAANAWKCCVR